MRMTLAAAALVAATMATGVAQAPRGQQSEGALRARPGADREPEFPAPTIRQYKPHSTLVVPQHPVPRAKFPVIDFHSHQPTPITAEQFDQLIVSMDKLNLQLLVNASGVTGDKLQQSLAAIRGSRHKDRMVQFTTVDFKDVGPGFGRRAAQQLEADVKAGALGLGEIGKEFGLRDKKADGSRLKL